MIYLLTARIDGVYLCVGCLYMCMYVYVCVCDTPCDICLYIIGCVMSVMC